ncbi:HKD family nuclease [Anoxybacillus kamchatkensis]|uniref:phospholipase D family protein n=1 Tax=Anoxybacillus ayderensis TaxID=265546 RepID=UPI0015EC5257|nr:phospholipase D family protein [Anoxybacillus ayderensis]MBA2879252.1 HKD family nuclease [Anoxybacillus ayderensis]
MQQKMEGLKQYLVELGFRKCLLQIKGKKRCQTMSVHLITNDLLDQFNELLGMTEAKLNIVSPFIGMQTASRLADWLIQNPNVKCNIITRFYREEFIENVSSVFGFEKLLLAGAKIYALIDLHSKLYMFDSHSVIIGSANFTHGGFVSNHEIAVLLSNEPEIASKCIEYFDDLLSRIENAGGGLVTQEWIDEEKEAIRKTAPNRKDKSVTYSNEAKKGVKLSKIVKLDSFEEFIQSTPKISLTQEEVWLKFEGTGEDRIPNHLNYQEMKGVRKRDLNRTFFPTRPSGIKKGDLLFLTIVSYDENNQPTPMIVGYARTDGYHHENVAGASEINEEPWKERFPYYVEFTEGKAIKAPMKNGIRLIDLYASLGKATYPSLQQKSNVSLKTLHSMHFRRSHIRVTSEARDYLMKELDNLFTKYGYVQLG